MPRGPRPRSILPCAFALALIALAADEPSGEIRLEGMPVEHRRQLAETLTRFDALPDDDQATVRTLDEAIARLDPAVQARYRVVLRRYHAWISGLDEAKRAELAKAPTVDAKLGLIAKWRKAERQADEKAKSRMILGVHPGDLGSMPPIEMANLLRIWFSLNDKEKARVEAIPTIPNRVFELRRLGFASQFQFQRFPPQDEAPIVARLEANDRVKTIFPGFYKRKEKEQAPEPATGKKKAELRPGVLANPVHSLAESVYFNDHPPIPVSKANLDRFEADLPHWFRSSIHPLPPEDANRRLTIVYRLIYPHPAEMPAPKPKADPAKPAAEARPKPAAPATSF